MTDNSPKAVVLRFYDLYNDGTPDSYGSERFLEVWSEAAVTNMPASAQAPDGSQPAAPPAPQSLRFQTLVQAHVYPGQKCFQNGNLRQ